MERLVLVAVFAISMVGCQAGPYGPGAGQSPAIVYHANPSLLPAGNPEQIWEHVVDIVDDYFEIAREIPVSHLDDAGRLDTMPLVGATLLEPWRHDSASFDERLEATLQTIRRQAVVHVSRVPEGYLVEVLVYKQLEVAKPMQSTGETSLLRYDGSLTRIENPIAEQPLDEGWIPLGRDTALEQRILGHLLSCRELIPM